MSKPSFVLEPLKTFLSDVFKKEKPVEETTEEMAIQQSFANKSSKQSFDQSSAEQSSMHSFIALVDEPVE